MDLRMYEDCWIGPVIAARGDGPASLRVQLRRGPDLAATLVFGHVLHLRTDFAEEFDFILRIEAERLPRTGPWPASARHLLHHHDNAYELVRVLLDGPTRIEALAVSLDVEQPAS